MIDMIETLVSIMGVYVALGVVFCIPFLARGVARIDATAASGTWGFRVLIAPGVIALWPLLARRWLGGVTSPPPERTPHKLAARETGSPAP